MKHKSMRPLQLAVLGAAGTIAPAIVSDLAGSPEVAGMMLMDLDGARAREVADARGGGKARAVEADATDLGQLASALKDAHVLINAASYRINLDAMRACLQAGCDYLDLGGLYWMTARQLELHQEFQSAGLLAVLGIGSSPGKTNLMALAAIRELGDKPDQIESIDVAAAGRDPAGTADGRLRPPYAIQTLLDELTLEPVLIRDGQPVRVASLTPGGIVDFGDPIGAAETVSVHLVRITAAGREVTMRAVTRPHRGIGGSVISTAAPAAAAVRLLARGSLLQTGVQPPERCLEPAQLFAELEERGASFTLAG